MAYTVHVLQVWIMLDTFETNLPIIYRSFYGPSYRNDNCLLRSIYVYYTYRATSDLLERTQIAKILLLQDQNRVGEFRNKSLEDIQLEGLTSPFMFIFVHKNQYNWVPMLQMS